MTTIPENFYRTSIKALILDAEWRFLLNKEANWEQELPGWWLDFGETPATCLEREIKEEMWLDVIYVSSEPKYFTATQHTKWHRIANILYEVKVNNLDFTPSDECTEVRFFTADEAKKENIFKNIEAFTNLYNPNLHL